MSVGLTKRQSQILDFMVKYRQQHGLSPTLEEIAQEMKLSRTSVFGHIGEMVKKGHVRRKSRKKASRNWEPVAERVVDLGAALRVVDTTFRGKGPDDPIADAPDRIKTKLEALPTRFR